LKADVRKLARGVVKDFAKFDLLTFSSAIAFQVLYAVVPLVMLGLAGLGLVGEQSLWTNHVAPALRRRLSPEAFTIAQRTAQHAMNGDRYAWATLGLLVTLYGVAASLRSMMRPLNNIYGARDTRSWGQRVLVSLGGGAVVMVLVYAALIVVLGGRLIHPHNVVLDVAVFLVRWIVALGVLLLINAALIRIVPEKKRPVRWISIGSALATLCWIGGTLGFGAFISTVSYSSFYGAFAGIVLLLIYLHVSAIAFLLGVTVDSLLREQTQGRSQRGRGRTRAGT